jgi:hypothetical protein
LFDFTYFSLVQGNMFTGSFASSLR